MSAAPAPQKARSSRLGKSSAAAAQTKRQPAKSLQRKALTPTPAIPGSLIQLKADVAGPEKKKKIQRQAAGKLEEKIQKKDAPPEKKKPVQLKSAVPVGPANDSLEKEADQVAQRVVQMKSASPIEPKKEPLAQTKSEIGNSPSQTDLSGLAGAGSPLPESIQRNMEQHLDTDFSDVKVHDDEAAQLKSSELGARAFTHGSNIYLGPGESQSDVSLMAHELTHVVQQRGGATSQRVSTKKKQPGKKDQPAATPEERAKQQGAALEGTTISHPKKGKLTVGETPTIELPEIKLPKVKKPFTSMPLSILPKQGKRSSSQATKWDGAVNGAGQLLPKVNTLLGPSSKMEVNGESVYYLKLRQSQQFIIGSKESIAKQVVRPFWNKKGLFRSFDVDHKQELQLGGQDEVENYWLLESQANQSSGRVINTELSGRINDILLIAHKVWPQVKKKGKGPKLPKSAAQARRKFTININKQSKKSLPISGHARDFWTFGQIANQGKHLKGLRVLKAKDIKKYNLKGSAKKIAIYSNPTGGRPAFIRWGAEKNNVPLTRDPGWGFSGKNSAAGIQFSELVFNQKTNKGSVSGKAFSKNKYVNGLNFTWPIVPMAGVPFGGAIQPDKKHSWVKNKLKAKGFSPVTIDQARLQPGVGLVASGYLSSDLPIFKGVQVGLDIIGSDVEMSALIPVNGVKLPPPFSLTYSSIRLFAGTRGFGAEGTAGIAIKGAGYGDLTIGMSSKKGFYAKGGFNFDSQLFTQSEVQFEYGQGQYAIVGTLGIGPGKLKGLKSATLTVGYSKENGLTAAGEGELTVPGVQKGEFQLQLAPNGDFTLGAGLTLADNIPRVSNGTINVVVSRKDGAWAVMGSGGADIALPGVNTKLKILYDKGLFDLSAQANYKRGLLEGTLLVGVTNRQIDPVTGKPTATQTENIVIYGGGGLTLQLAPWLKAGATVLLLPDGSVLVTGEIGIPQALNLFDEKKYAPDKPLFKVGIDIPIFGVSFLGKRIGIFANISGGLEAAASIGPGQLTDLGLSVTYNPDREQDTKVTGKAKLNVPAYAGLTLFISGSIGAGLLIVSAEGGLKARGTLGVAGALKAGVDVDWTPNKGLIIDAVASLEAQPKLKISLSAFVLVEADVFLGTIELYENEWELAAKEFGSDLKVGVSFPVHYEEGKKFNIGLDDVKFTYPKINVMDTVKGLID